LAIGIQNTSVSQNLTSADLAGFNYGNMNEFQVMSDSSGPDMYICFKHAEIVFTYETAIPTMSQWALMIMALIMTSLGLVAIKKRYITIVR